MNFVTLSHGRYHYSSGFLQTGFLAYPRADLKSFDHFFGDITVLLLRKWKRSTFDFLINNAGIDRASSIKDTSEQDFDELMNIHFKGVYFLSQSVAIHS